MNYEYMFHLIAMDEVNQRVNNFARERWEPFMMSIDQVRSDRNDEAYIHKAFLGIMFRRLYA